MLQKKKENQGQVNKKEVAKLLEKEKGELARIKTEQIIRDDYMIEVLEIMEVYFNLLVSRFGLIEASKVCDPGITEAVCTILWATPYLQSEVSELKAVAGFLGNRYGKEFVQDALENKSGTVSERVIKRLRVSTPTSHIVEAYIQAIAKTYNIPYVEPLEPLPDNLVDGGFSADMFPDAPATLGGGDNYGGKPGGGLPSQAGLDNLFPPAPGGAYPPQQSHVPYEPPTVYPPMQPAPDLYPPTKPSFQPEKPPSAPPPASYPAEKPVYPPDNTPSTVAGMEVPAPHSQYNVDGQILGTQGVPPDSTTTPTSTAYIDVQPSPPRDPSGPPPGYPQPSGMKVAPPPAELPSPPPNLDASFPMPPGVGGVGVPDAAPQSSVGEESNVPDFDELLTRFHALKTDENTQD